MYQILLLAAVFGMKNCEICFENKPIDKFATLKNCNHDVFCLECVGKHSITLVGHQEIKTCPKCRRIIVAVNDEPFQDFQWKQRKWIYRIIWRIHRTLTALSNFLNLISLHVWGFINNHQTLFSFVALGVIASTIFYIIFSNVYDIPIFLPEAFDELNYAQMLQGNDALQHVEQFNYEITEQFGTFGFAVVGPLFSSIFHVCRNYSFLCTKNTWKTAKAYYRRTTETFSLTKDKSALIHEKKGCTHLYDDEINDFKLWCGVETNVYDLNSTPVFLRFENIDFVLTGIGFGHYHYQPTESGTNYLEFMRTDKLSLCIDTFHGRKMHSDVIRIVYDVYEGVVDGRKSNLINFRKMTWAMLDAGYGSWDIRILLQSDLKYGSWDDFTNEVTLQTNQNFPLLQRFVQEKAVSEFSKYYQELR